MQQRPYQEVDVFTSTPFGGNPLAVVVDARGLDTGQMQRFAAWTNLSETTFLLTPTDPQADYHVRIFTPASELPFAGHPTLGSCHAWLAAGGVPRQPDRIVQQCGVGLVHLRRDATGLAFRAPAMRRSAPADGQLEQAAAALGVAADAVLRAQWLDNGPRWLGLLLRDATLVRQVVPDHNRLRQVGLVGVIGAARPGDGSAADFEVRAFAAAEGVPEDPVTGSLNAALAQWLIADGVAPAHYVAAQGTCVGRSGRVRIDASGADVWVGGDSATRVEGTVDL